VSERDILRENFLFNLIYEAKLEVFSKDYCTFAVNRCVLEIWLILFTALLRPQTLCTLSSSSVLASS